MAQNPPAASGLWLSGADWCAMMAAMRCAGFLILWAICSTARLAAAPDFYSALQQSLVPDEVVTYKTVGQRDLKLHVFFPSGHRAGDAAPALVGIHGGGWTRGSVQRFYPYAHGLVKEGYVGISVEYRLAQADGQGVTVVDCVKDCRAALRFIRAHAADWGIDPRRIAVCGASAGGHLAAGAALFDGIDHADDDLSVSCRPDALVLLYPVIDTSAAGYGQRLIGRDWRRLSPVDQVTAGVPPTIIFHGDADTATPHAGVRRFAVRMEQSGNPCEVIVWPGGVHAYIDQNRAIFDGTLRRMSAFLARHLTGRQLPVVDDAASSD